MTSGGRKNEDHFEESKTAYIGRPYEEKETREAHPSPTKMLKNTTNLRRCRRRCQAQRGKRWGGGKLVEEADCCWHTALDAKPKNEEERRSDRKGIRKKSTSQQLKNLLGQDPAMESFYFRSALYLTAGAGIGGWVGKDNFIYRRGEEIQGKKDTGMWKPLVVGRPKSHDRAAYSDVREGSSGEEAVFLRQWGRA